MMNMFRRKQLSSDVTLHNSSMHSSNSPKGISSFIFSGQTASFFKPMYFYMLGKNIFCQTRPRTIFYFPFFNSIQRNIKFFFTNFTDKCCSFFSSRLFHSNGFSYHKSSLTFMTTKSCSVSSFLKRILACWTDFHGFIVSHSNLNNNRGFLYG